MTLKDPKIVVLDGYTLNPGDLSWSGFEAIGSISVHERTLPTEVIQRAKDCEVILTNKTLVTREMMAQLPRLKYIGVLATGYNVVDIAAASEREIMVTNVPNYGPATVAQFTFALILHLCHHVWEHDHSVREGEWQKRKDFCYRIYPQVELVGKTLGVIGYGAIGKAVTRLGKAFGMKVMVYSRFPEANADLEFVSLDHLLAASDFVSVHTVLTTQNERFLDKTKLGKMKKSAFLINVARGGLIHEEDLARALNAAGIAGAALDVLSQEPPPEDNPLLAAKNCLLTPHIAWATKEARTRLMDIAVENLRAFLKGEPQNVIKV